MRLYSKKGFPKSIKDDTGRIWTKVINEKHRDKLEETGDYDFEQCSEDVFGRFSWHLYYSDRVFKPSESDTEIMHQLDEMLKYFITYPMTLSDK